MRVGRAQVLRRTCSRQRLRRLVWRIDRKLMHEEKFTVKNKYAMVKKQRVDQMLIRKW